MLLASVMITSVFSVTLTSKTSGGKSDRRLLASQAARQLTGRLKNFVTGCDCDISTGVCSAASCTIQGPTPLAGVSSWSFNCPTCDPAIIDCWPAPNPYYSACGAGSDSYALALGDHAIKGLLPTFFEDAPYNARVVYTVTNSATINGRPVPKVEVDVKWTEP